MSLKELTYDSIEKVHREARDNQHYSLSENGGVVKKVKQLDPIDIPSLFVLANSAGLLEDELFDEIEAGVNGNGLFILSYSYLGLTQFQITLNINSQQSFKILKRFAEFPLQQENGDNILLEDGFILKTEGLTP